MPSQCHGVRFVLLVAVLFAGRALQGQNAGQAQTDSAAERASKDQTGAPNGIGSSYRKWLDEDVRWIITPEERAAFLKLPTDSERDQFVEQFWSRRNPNPGSSENTFKEEHYRRIAYSTFHFSSRTLVGWQTARGGMYILHGPPDSVDSHPQGGIYQRSPARGGPKTEADPFEVWQYRHVQGIGDDIEIEFVDKCRCGEYSMAIDKSPEKLIPVPSTNPFDQLKPR
jgi:GWxTD domain-containing protein